MTTSLNSFCDKIVSSKCRILLFYLVILLHNLFVCAPPCNYIYKACNKEIDQRSFVFSDDLSIWEQQWALIQKYKGQEIWLFKGWTSVLYYHRGWSEDRDLLLRAEKNWRWRQQHLGKVVFLDLDASVTKWLREVCRWILTLIFSLLISRLSLWALLIFGIAAQPLKPLVRTPAFTSVWEISRCTWKQHWTYRQSMLYKRVCVFKKL